MDTPDPGEFSVIHAWRFQGVWRADVSKHGSAGHGQAASWIDAVNAAIEDLEEKKEKKS